MNPIFEKKGQGQGIGHSFESFSKHFIDICEDHLKNGRAKAFAFILYDFYDNQMSYIFNTHGGFAQLDRLAGETVTIFYLHSPNERLVNVFNEIFLEAFEIDDEFQLPFVLFFNVKDKEVSDIKIVELEYADLMFAFKELYDIIEDYVEKTIGINTTPPKSKSNKLFNSVKKIALDKLLTVFVEKGMDKLIS